MHCFNYPMGVVVLYRGKEILTFKIQGYCKICNMYSLTAPHMRPEFPIKVITSLVQFSCASSSCLTPDWVRPSTWCNWQWSYNFEFDMQKKATKICDNIGHFIKKKKDWAELIPEEVKKLASNHVIRWKPFQYANSS